MPFPLDTGQDLIEHHFRRRGFVWSEDFFLSILNDPRSKYDVYWSALGLRKVGSIRAIPILVSFLTYPMQDVKCVAILTIAHIGRASVTPLLADALLSPKFREKTYAMCAILDSADDRAVLAVLQYFSKNRSKLRAGKLDSFGDGVRYLAKFMSTSGEARAFVEGIPAYWTRIPEGTRQEMKKHIPELVAQFEADSSRYSRELTPSGRRVC
jgi:hypothetical protein